jgi:hypothetical protein
MKDDLRIELQRARRHLDLLEQDATHPLEFLVQKSPTAQPLILRPGNGLRTAHSDVEVEYGQLRGALIDSLRRRVDELTVKLAKIEPGFTLEQLEYGDHTEA